MTRPSPTPAEQHDWRAWARGIDPWPGAWLAGVPGHNIDRSVVVRVESDSDFSEYAAHGCASRCVPGVLRVSGWTELRPMDEDDHIDLADPDTRAAFDRRLALRLGAPADLVAEGVNVYAVVLGWYLQAGGPHRMLWTPNPGSRLPLVSGHHDPLLARAQMWWRA